MGPAGRPQALDYEGALREERMITTFERNGRDEIRQLVKRTNQAWLNSRAEELAGCLHESMVIHPGYIGRT